MRSSAGAGFIVGEVVVIGPVCLCVYTHTHTQTAGFTTAK